ncbi:MAG: hypothetical protein JXA82_06325 [Sedimentisphaerales bacterium]|nr:hypothetical protein [Sedimentisphaerales bacterium]
MDVEGLALLNEEDRLDPKLELLELEERELKELVDVLGREEDVVERDLLGELDCTEGLLGGALELEPDRELLLELLASAGAKINARITGTDQRFIFAFLVSMIHSFPWLSMRVWPYQPTRPASTINIYF